MSRPRFLHALANPFVLIGMFLLIVALSFVLPIYFSYRHTQSVKSEVRARDGWVETKAATPQWCEKLPAALAERIASLFETVTWVACETVDDRLLADIAACRTVERLEIGINRPCEVTDTGMRYLQDLENLQSFSLYTPQVSDAGLSHLSQLLEMEVLELRCPLVTDAGLQYFADMHKLSTLELFDCQIEGAGLQHLKLLKELRVLTIQNAPLADEHLVDLAVLSNLIGLELDGTTITDRGVEYVAQLHTLQTIDLGGTQITDAGLMQLTQLKNLNRLYLDRTLVTAKAVAQVVNQIGEYIRLDLSGTDVGDEDLDAFLSMLPIVVLLDIGDTRVSTEVRAEINAAGEAANPDRLLDLVFDIVD